jgi:hypothetical protein
VTPDVVMADVLAFAPELRCLSTPFWADALAYVNEMDLSGSIGESPQVARVARIYLAAHLGTISKRAGSGAAGPVTDESAGNVHRSYAAATMATAYALGATMYGQQYLALTEMSLAAAPLVI